MSTLWTPGGEHPVDPENEPTSSDFSELSPEEQEQAEAQQQVLNKAPLGIYIG